MAENKRPIEVATVVPVSESSGPVPKAFQRPIVVRPASVGDSDKIDEENVSNTWGTENEGAVISPLTATFHLDLSSAVAAVTDKTDW